MNCVLKEVEVYSKAIILSVEENVTRQLSSQITYSSSKFKEIENGRSKERIRMEEIEAHICCF